MKNKYITKRKLGMIGTKKCRRCRDYFYPSQGKQKFCHYCQGKSTIKGRPMKTKFCRVFSCGKERKPGEGARGLCKEHYNILIKNPATTKRKRIKAAQGWLDKGARLCEMFKDCEVYFFSKARNQFGIQKICPTCAKKRSYKK